MSGVPGRTDSRVAKILSQVERGQKEKGVEAKRLPTSRPLFLCKQIGMSLVPAA
jgi:hypothetical protein